MSAIEKSGMLVNVSGAAVGWVVAGADVEMAEGDVVISHHKTAEKAGLLEQFNSMKAENKPAKVKKEVVEGKEKPSRVRVDVPQTGTYTVVKAGYGAKDKNEGRAAAFALVCGGTTFEEFFVNAKSYTHIKRDGSEAAEVSPKEVMSYAIRRGVVNVD